MSAQNLPRLPRPPGLSTTGAGSLPHTQQELALQQALAVDVPYAPQLPRHSAAEYMLPQALVGLPGLRYDADGAATVSASVWARDGDAFNRRLDEALAGDVSAFAPPPLSYVAWQPFLWEIEARKLAFAKTQLAGPTTLRWLVRLDDGRRCQAEPGLDRAIYRLVLARATAMVHAIRERGATPILCLDEPGLFALDAAEPGHLVYLRELGLGISALRQAGALVALHCCSNTHWPSVLALGLDYLSFDVRLSLGPILRAQQELRAFAHEGGRLMLGIVPTNAAEPYDLDDLLATTGAALHPRAATGLPLGECLLSPACGLALRSIPETEQVFHDLRLAQRALRAAAVE